MSQEIFQFKKFKIVQNSASVFKVNTEAVLITAWTELNSVSNILEIGCGTGVISLGFCQRLPHNTFIKAIDINPNAIDLTRKNIEINNQENIEIELISIQEYSIRSILKYDLIISNPPYFNTDLKSTKERNLVAKYTDTLSFDDLILSSISLLNQTGSLSLIIPNDNVNEISDFAFKNGLNLNRHTEIYTSHKKGALRSLLQFSFLKSELTIEKLYLVDQMGNYTEEYKKLTKDYYTMF